jgi:hypothetical protein
MTVQRSEQRERKIHIMGMSDFVFEPSRDYGFAMGLFGFGFGMLIVSRYLLDMFLPLAVMGMLIGFPCAFCGLAWAYMIRVRLNSYEWHIAQTAMETKHEQETALPYLPGIRPIPVNPDNPKRSFTAKMEDENPLSEPDWRSVAFWVILNNREISETEFCRTAPKVVSQPVYSKFYKYALLMKYIEKQGEKNILTDSGRTYLTQFTNAM